MKTKTKRRITSISIRENAKKDRSPSWEGCDTWTKEKYNKTYYDARNYYEENLKQKDYKKIILEWLSTKKYDKKLIADFKKVQDKYCTSTAAIIAACLLKGMLDSRDDFNNGKNLAEVVYNNVLSIIETNNTSVQEVSTVVKPPDNSKEVAMCIACKIDEVIEKFWDTDTHEVSFGNITNILKIEKVSVVHAKHIIDFYRAEYLEFQQLLEENVDPQLKEAYKHLTKKQIKNFILLHKEIQTACENIINGSKKPKVINKSKIISKLKFKEHDTTYNIKSIDPKEIIGAKEVWCFDTKTRKIIRYAAQDSSGLTVKGSAILNFNTSDSKSKMLRKPQEQLATFVKLEKNKMLSFLEELTTIDIIPNGKITENTLLLKKI